MPGAIPNFTTVPLHVGEPTPAAVEKIRPLSQYGSAEEISSVFKREPMDKIQPGDFEQADASFEELRKVAPANLTPIRPLPGPGSAEEIAGGTTDPALMSGE